MENIGILFDWDGVIIDSSRQHEASWERLAREEGRVLPEGHFKTGFGKKNEWIIPQLLNWASEPAEVRRLSLRKEAAYREIVVESGLNALPGVRVFLERLRDAGVPSCIGSSTHRENITTLLGVLGFEGLFGGMVTSEDVAHGKPHPEPYLKASTMLGHAPGDILAIEDSPTGVASAHAAGLMTIMVPDLIQPDEETRGRALHIGQSLDDVLALLQG